MESNGAARIIVNSVTCAKSGELEFLPSGNVGGNGERYADWWMARSRKDLCICSLLGGC